MLIFLIIVFLALISSAGVLYLKTSELKALQKGVSIVEITPSKSKTQSVLFLIFIILFLIAFFVQLIVWGKYSLPEPASLHGENYDFLMHLTLIIISIVFVIIHLILGYFCVKYSYNPNRKSTFFAHSNKLEMIWTILPSLALAVLIIYGLTSWNQLMKPLSNKEHITIELYAKQFDWTARYAGKDNQLGKTHFSFISDNNDLGIDKSDDFGRDDKIVKGEFHLPKGKAIQFVFRSRDVIHSAYMPHFRAQMNCVPGVITNFNFTPKYTTSEMKEITKNDEFEYILLCNKICGAAHYNMQMKIVVDTPEEYKKWISQQKEFRTY